MQVQKKRICTQRSEHTLNLTIVDPLLPLGHLNDGDTHLSRHSAKCTEWAARRQRWVDIQASRRAEEGGVEDRIRPKDAVMKGGLTGDGRIWLCVFSAKSSANMELYYVSVSSQDLGCESHL